MCLFVCQGPTPSISWWVLDPDRRALARLCHSLALSLALSIALSLALRASLVHQDDVKCPIAVIWGTKDGLTPSQGPVGRGLRARADAWVDIEGAGHVFFDERPDETIRALTEWVARF